MKNMKLVTAIIADGRTQGAIAKSAGINTTTLSLIINEQRKARVSTARAIAAALGKTPCELGFDDAESDPIGCSVKEHDKRTNGKTLRDEFAMAALTGMCAHTYSGGEPPEDALASWAYYQADAMLKAREVVK